MAPVLFVIGAALIIAGTAVIYWPVGLIAAGVLALIAGWDLNR